MVGTKRLGQTLRGWRLIRGMTVEELSRATNIPATTLNAYERGTRTPGGDRLLTLMVTLRLAVQDLTEEAGS